MIGWAEVYLSLIHILELLGASGRRADLEAILTAVESLSKCVPDFRLELGHAGFFRAIASQLPISPEERETIREVIEAKNYAALNSILDDLEPSLPVTAMRRLPRLFGGEEVFAEAEPLCVTEEAKEMLEYLRSLYQDLAALGLGSRLMVDLSLVQRNDYYTGIAVSYTHLSLRSAFPQSAFRNWLRNSKREAPVSTVPLTDLPRVWKMES